MTLPDMGFFDLEAVMLAGAADITALLPTPKVQSLFLHDQHSNCMWLPSQ